MIRTASFIIGWGIVKLYSLTHLRTLTHPSPLGGALSAATGLVVGLNIRKWNPYFRVAGCAAARRDITAQHSTVLVAAIIDINTLSHDNRQLMCAMSVPKAGVEGEGKADGRGADHPQYIMDLVVHGFAMDGRQCYAMQQSTLKRCYWYVADRTHCMQTTRRPVGLCGLRFAVNYCWFILNTDCRLSFDISEIFSMRSVIHSRLLLNTTECISVELCELPPLNISHSFGPERCHAVVWHN